MAKSILEEDLKKAITSIEAEASDIIKQLKNALNERNKVISEYQVVLEHVQRGLNLNGRKPRNIRFHSSPQQLIATILKREPQKWLNRKDITHQAMELDEQEVGEKSPSVQLQSIAYALSTLKRKDLVEKCTMNKEDY